LPERYGRILERIDRLHPKVRESTIRILGWIGCSRTPLRSTEVLHALAVAPGNTSFSSGQKVFLSITQICGPIVEVHNGFLQFVHFTAKRQVKYAAYCGVK
jgi:hypothetical protein